ncbi:MAG: hypothetical protein K6G03_05155 [Lachnospiraceae bacterium]|nr:hypothetical protein [Lachnospiraceae bacterium]
MIVAMSVKQRGEMTMGPFDWIYDRDHDGKLDFNEKSAKMDDMDFMFKTGIYEEEDEDDDEDDDWDDDDIDDLDDDDEDDEDEDDDW